MQYQEAETSVQFWIRPLQTLIESEGVTDVVMNRPGEVFVYRGAQCERVQVPDMTLNYCVSLADAVGTLPGNKRGVSERNPCLEATLPGWLRLGLVVPPACLPGTVALVIRRPSDRLITPDEMEAQGIFDRVVTAQHGLSQGEAALLELKAARQWKAFLAEAMRQGLFIVFSGHTGSGKTTMARAFATYIPHDARIITVETTDEMRLPHENMVRLFWNPGEQGVTRVTSTQLMDIALRLRPDAIIYGEVRGREAFDLLNAGESGHRWCVTTIHASSPPGAVDRLVMKALPAAEGMNYLQMKRFVLRTVDVIVQFGNDGGDRFIQDVWYDPALKRRLADAGVSMGMEDAA